MSQPTFATGELIQRGAYAIGFIDIGGGPLFTPWYNHTQTATFDMGPKWRSSYHMRLTFPDASTVTFEDANGATWTFTKNVDGSYTPEPGYHSKLVKVTGSGVYTLTLTNGRQYWFDINSGKLLWVFPRDLIGACAISYDGNGRLSEVEVRIKNDQGQYVATGRKLTVSYDGNGRISSVSSPGSRQISFTYDGSGRVYTITDPEGNVTTYGYDGYNRLASLTRNNHTWSYTYNNDNLVASITDPRSQSITYAYALDGRYCPTCTTPTDALGHSTAYDFDSYGRLTKVTDALSNYVQYGYDNAWNRTSMRNQRGYYWYYQYNSYGDLTQVTDPYSKVTTYEYGYNSADDHLLKKITDPLGHETTLTYDSGGHLLTVTDPNGNVTEYTYNTNGTLASVTDARDKTTTYDYDSEYSPAYVTSITDPYSKTTYFDYDAVGNRTSVTDANGHTTFYTYDDNRRVTQITNPDETTRTFQYDCCGLTSVTDENGHTTTYTHDDAGRLTAVTDAELQTTEYTYDNADRLTAVTDTNDHTTSYSYNNANRLTGISYPDSTNESFAYYATGALYTRTDGKGATTTYWRDNVDRLCTIDYPGTGSDVEMGYDDEGRLAWSTKPDTLYQWDSYGGYTKYDHLIAVRRKMGSMTNYRTTSYQYDANYNRTRLEDGAGNVTTYSYDDRNGLTGVTTGGASTSFTYDDVGNRTQKTLPNSAYTTYTYNSRNWLTNLYNRKSDATLISSYAYAHDYVGNRTSMTEANGDVTSYEYDDVYRLMSEVKRDDEQTVLYRYQYTYDGVGNRLSENNSGTIYYTYDNNNKLTQFVLGNDTTSFGYDNNGNTTSMTLPDETVWNYGYDYENRLTSVTDNDSYTAAYTYAADGTRIRAQESNAAYTDKWFQYDGMRPVLEGTLSSDTWTTLNRYTWEGDSYYSPLAWASIGGSNRYFMYDGLGSTRQLLNADQTTTDTYSYEAFGNLMSSSGSTANPYKYVGSLGYYQTGSSLMHLGARYYMPEVGRFISRDPLREGANWYSYVQNRPTLVTDPAGLWGYGDCVKFCTSEFVIWPVVQIVTTVTYFTTVWVEEKIQTWVCDPKGGKLLTKIIKAPIRILVTAEVVKDIGLGIGAWTAGSFVGCSLSCAIPGNRDWWYKIYLDHQ